MPWKIAQFSCDNTAWRSPGFDRIRAQAPRVLINQGDTPYCNAAYNLYGIDSAAFTASTTQADAEAKYLQWLSKPEVAALLALRSSGMRAIWQPDDHEWADNDWDHTDAELGASFTSQALINQHWARCCAAQDVTMAANWDNPLPNAADNTQRPSGALQESQNPATTAYRITYFVEDYDIDGTLLRQQIGPTAPAATGARVRIIYLDCISYRSPTIEAESASKVMLGTQQMAWLQAALEAAVSAGVAHVLISSTKKVYGSSADNTDMWWFYQTERTAMLTMIDATGAKPIWLSGDRHRLQVAEQRKSAGALCDLIDICACPIGVTVVALNPASEGLLWHSPRQGYALHTVDASGLRSEVRDAETDSVLWACTFVPGSNVPVYDAGPAAFRLA